MATPQLGIGSRLWMGLESIRFPLCEIVNKLGATRSRESTRYLRATDPYLIFTSPLFVRVRPLRGATHACLCTAACRCACANRASSFTTVGVHCTKRTKIDKVRGLGLRRAGKRKGRGSGGAHRRGTNTPSLRLLTHVARWGLLAQHRLCGNQPGRVKCFSLSFFDLRPFPFPLPLSLPADRCVPPSRAHLPLPMTLYPHRFPATPYGFYGRLDRS